MAVISYSTSTELDAVNSILMSVGEGPVNTLDVQSPEVAIAQKTLRQVCREVQAEGWVFNTELEYELTIDSNNKVTVPDNVLELDLNRFKHHDDYDVIRKSDNGTMRLYNRYKHSFEFADVSESKLYADIIWMVEFGDMPPAIKDYVTARACRVASNRMVSAPKAAEALATDEALARSLALEYDTRQADYNIFSTSQYRTSVNPYRPYQVLNR